MPPKRVATPLNSESHENDINMYLQDSVDPSTPKRRRLETSSPTSFLPKSSPMSIIGPSPPRPGRKVKGKFHFTPKLPSLFETIEPLPSKDSSPGQNQGSTSATPAGSRNDTPVESTAAEKHAQKVDEKRRTKESQATRLMSLVSKSDKDGGFGFISLGDFLDTLLNSKDPHLSSTATQFAQRHAANLVNLLHSRAPEATDDATMKLLIPILQREGQAVQDLLSRDWNIKDRDLLHEF